MSKLTIYASDLKPFTSVIGVFNGSEDFAIENPWFPIPGAKPCDPKIWMNAIIDSKGGLFLNAPRLLRKTPTGTFSSFFVIGWTTVVQNQKLKKGYRIHAPYGGQPLKRKQKLMISPGNRELADDDNKLLLFNWQLTMVQDVLLIARIFNIDMTKYQGMDNDKFYPAFVQDVNAKLKARKATTFVEVDPELINSWMTVPIVSKNKRKEEIFIYDVTHPQEMAFETLMSSFYEAITSTSGKQTYDIKGIEKVWDRPSCFAMPTFRLKTFVRKSDPEGNIVQGLDSRCIVYAKATNPKDPDFNSNMPEGLYTKRQITKTRKITITKENMSELWGESEYNPKPDKHESASYDGCIFIAPSISYSFHEKGSPTIDWRIDTLAINKVVKVVSDDLEDACDFITDPTNEPTEEQKQNNSDGDGAEFIGNETEMDPDALI